MKTDNTLNTTLLPLINNTTLTTKNNTTLLPTEKKINILDSYYDTDPITLAQFWEYDDNNNKIQVYSDDKINDLIYYYDSNNRLLCFELESIKFLKCYNIKTHPYTFDIIPLHIFNNICCIDIIKNDDIYSIAANVFKSLGILAININYKWFLILSQEQLLKFYYELNEFWIHNFTKLQQDEILINIGHTITFNKKKSELGLCKIEEVQKYLLIEMKILLTCNIEEYKFMISYIITSALSTVIPEINEMYPGYIYLNF